MLSLNKEPCVEEKERSEIPVNTENKRTVGDTVKTWQNLEVFVEVGK